MKDEITSQNDSDYKSQGLARYIKIDELMDIGEAFEKRKQNGHKKKGAFQDNDERVALKLVAGLPGNWMKTRGMIRTAAIQVL